jgi:hypothetical protein
MALPACDTVHARLEETKEHTAAVLRARPGAPTHPRYHDWAAALSCYAGRYVSLLPLLTPRTKHT